MIHGLPLRVEPLEKREQPNELFGLGGLLLFGLDSGFSPRWGVVSDHAPARELISSAPVPLAAVTFQGETDHDLGTAAPVVTASSLTHRVSARYQPEASAREPQGGFLLEQTVGALGGETPVISPDVTPPDNRIGIQGGWQQRAPYPERLHRLACDAASNGVVYCVGGRSESGSSSNRTYSYDWRTDTWTRRADIPLPGGIRAYDSSVMVNDKWYVFGGGTNQDPPLTLGSLWIYDVATDTWTQGQPMLGLRWGSCVGASTDQTKIIVAGGANTSSQRQTWIYDIGTNSYLIGSTMPNPAARTNGAVSPFTGSGNGELHCFGDVNNGRLHQKYDIAANTWAPAADMPVAITGPAVMAEPLVGLIAVVGAGNDGGGPGMTHIWNPYASGGGAWLGSFPGGPQTAGTAGAIWNNGSDGHAHVVAGYNGSAVIDTHWFADYF